jgi:Short C-terminal domain
MKTSNKISVAVLALGLFVLASVAQADVVQISPDTYLISRISRAGMFASMPKLKMAVIREANAFAEAQGKIAIPLSSKETPAAPGQWPTFDYQFRVVAKDDPEAQRTALVPRADVVIESNRKIEAEIKTKDETEKTPDLYSELLKLDDLRKRGVLTDAEFEEQKKKLLSAAK